VSDLTSTSLPVLNLCPLFSTLSSNPPLQHLPSPASAEAVCYVKQPPANLKLAGTVGVIGPAVFFSLVLHTPHAPAMLSLVCAAVLQEPAGQMREHMLQARWLTWTWWGALTASNP